jgi:hypothetical protein
MRVDTRSEDIASEPPNSSRRRCERNNCFAKNYLNANLCLQNWWRYTLHICDKFWGPKREHISVYEKFKLFGVTGGVPRYLEEILPDQTAEENIHRLGFMSTGILFSEFDHIFTDLFNGRNEKYRAIVKCLTNGSASLEQITKRLGRVKGGDISEALEYLEESEFLARDYSWHLIPKTLQKLAFRRRQSTEIRRS